MARILLRWMLVSVVPVALLSCRRESSQPPAQPSAGSPYPGATAPAQPGWTTPAPAATVLPAATMPPAVGFYCSTDQDLQCPFGRCLGGRCGGCETTAECKPGAACMASPFGMVCVGGNPASPPAATPAPPTVTAAPPIGAQPPSSDAFAGARALCVQRTNEYRARVGAAPVARHAGGEPCGDQQARTDATSGRAHGAFGACGEMAQNECPGWPGSPEQVVASCLQAMFDEGPGEGTAHGHYNNMTNRSYSSVACGFHVAADGSLWVVQDFFRQGR